MTFKKLATLAMATVVSASLLVGCSSGTSQYDYQPTYQNQPQQAGGGCGVTAPAEDSGLAGASTVEAL